MQLTAETERLAIEKEHLERDEELVTKELKTLEVMSHVEAAKEEKLRLDAM